MSRNDMLDDDAMVTVTQAAKDLGVSKSLIIGWAERELLERHGRPYHWRYRMGDVRDVETRTRNCPNPTAFKRKATLIAA